MTGISKSDYLFKGMVTCDVCGCAATPYLAKGKYVYACTGHKGCKRVNVREESLLEQAAAVLDKMVLKPSTEAFVM